MRTTTMRWVVIVGICLLVAVGAAAQVNDFDRNRPGRDEVVPLPEPIAPAPQPLQIVSSEPQLLGFTTVRFPANRGVLSYGLGCREEFGPSRMCTLAEINRTLVIPVEPGVGQAWVNVTAELAATAGIFDASTGQNRRPELRQPTNLTNCRGWTTTAPNHNAVALDLGGASCYGGLMLVRCDEMLSVACCGMSR